MACGSVFVKMILVQASCQSSHTGASLPGVTAPDKILISTSTKAHNTDAMLSGLTVLHMFLLVFFPCRINSFRHENSSRKHGVNFSSRTGMKVVPVSRKHAP